MGMLDEIKKEIMEKRGGFNGKPDAKAKPKEKPAKPAKTPEEIEAYRKKMIAKEEERYLKAQEAQAPKTKSDEKPKEKQPQKPKTKSKPKPKPKSKKSRKPAEPKAPAKALTHTEALCLLAILPKLHRIALICSKGVGK